MQTSNLPTPPSTEEWKTYTILIVDDEPNILTSIQDTLRIEGFKVLTATSGEDGLRIIETTPVQVVMSDQKMPGGMSGTELLKTIKTRYPDIVTMVLSAFSEPEYLLAAMNDANAAYYLLKPCPQDELIARVTQALRRHHSIVMEKERLRNLRTLLDDTKPMTDMGTRTIGMVHNIKNMLLPLAAQLDAIRMDLKDVIRSDAESTTPNPSLARYGSGMLEMIDSGETTLSDITGFMETALSAFRRKPTTPEIFDFAKLIQHNIRLEKARSELWRIQFHFKTIGHDFTMEGLKGYLSSNVIELIKNAGDAILQKNDQGRGNIWITVEEFKGNQMLKLTVRDDGCGIANDIKARVFEPQFTTKGENGTGFGLSELAELVRQHSGTIEVDSTSGEGATFVITLPKRQNYPSPYPLPQGEREKNDETRCPVTTLFNSPE